MYKDMAIAEFDYYYAARVAMSKLSGIQLKDGRLKLEMIKNSNKY